jgi:creatine kinase
MFKDMAADPYLASAGIAGDWPYGRGCYISGDKQFLVWVGEEDHLRIMCMKKGTLLNEVFDRLSGAIKVMDGIADFAYR